MTEKSEEPIQVRFQCCVRTMPFEKMLDLAGFLICPEHLERRYGWRSARVTAERPRGNYGESPLEQDRAIVKELFGDGE